MIIKNCDELFRWIFEAGESFYRGCSKTDEIVATLGRPKYNEKRTKFPDFEFDIIKKLSLALIQSFNENIEFSELIEIGQHFGIPTRYIDFTSDPFVAIYFGMGRGQKNKKFKLLRINKINTIAADCLQNYETMLGDLSEFTLGDLGQLKLFEIGGLKSNTILSRELIESSFFRMIYKRFFDSQYEFTLVKYDACRLNSRLNAQSGLFITMKDYLQPLSQKLYEIVEIDLSNFEHNKLREIVRKRGINAEFLFPNDIREVNIKKLIASILEEYEL